MLVKRTILILLSLLILTGTVSAYYANFGPGATHFVNPVGPDVQWIIAAIGQQNTITLVAYNTTYGQPVKNTAVTFSVNDPSLGSMSPQTVTTDATGTATSNFIVNSSQPKSGTATITAVVQSNEGPGNSGALYTTTLSWDQKIDHNQPYAANFTYDTYDEVASLIPVNIVVTDKWGNLIDDKFEKAHTPALPAHNLTIHVNGPSPPNDCGFTDFGLTHDHEFSLDPNGEVDVNITSATKPGWHYILTDPMGNMPEQMKMFDTVSRNPPFSITQVFDPDGDPYPTITITPTNKFVFYYTVYDKYGNPTTDQDILVTITSLDRDEGAPQTFTVTSGENGENWSTFGPKSFTNRYSINATTAGNSTIWANKTVRFYSAAPNSIDVSANPQSMPSIDANPNIYSNISAKVVDEMGNGVGGVAVSFAITNNAKNPAGATVTQAASFSKTSTVTTATATTDENGYAVVKFYPGAFATLHQTGYEESATGTTTVSATWSTNERDVKVIWKNYPYLSAVVSVYPPQVQVGNTVNISVKLNGDGWALYRYPIDVDLVMDRSGSMGDSLGTTTEEVAAQAGAKNFVNNMSESSDRVGLFSFSSWNSADPEHSATHDAALSSTFIASTSTINQAITNLHPSGNTALRPAVKQAIDDLAANPNGNSKAVQAVIVMTDGNWNDEGSPSGHGTGWPVGNPDISLDGTGNFLPSDYRYYSDLPAPKGTLTPYAPTSTCSVYSSTICDAYTCGSSGCKAPYPYRTSSGKCKVSSNGASAPTPFNITSSPLSPSWCSASKLTCSKWDCSAWVMKYKSTDGEFTNQNLSIYAASKGIRLYFIFFATTPDATASSTMSTMANATGGFYQHALTAADLDDAYKKIAGDLKTEAGVDTTATMDFGNLIVDNHLPTDVTADPYFEYIGDPTVASPRKGIDLPATWPGSTMLDKYNKTPNGVIDTHFSPGSDDSGTPFTDTGPIIINQTSYWNTAPQKLHFTIGTVNVNETWETDFRLKVLREGNILIFGPASIIDFNNGNAGASSMTMPNLSLSASMNPINLGLAQNNIDVIGLARTDSGAVKSTLPVSWTLTYNGLSTNTIIEEVSYIRDNDPPVSFAILSGKASDLTGHIQTATLNTEKLPPGGYTIQVHAYAQDATVTKSCGPYTYTTQGRAFIKLE